MRIRLHPIHFIGALVATILLWQPGAAARVCGQETLADVKQREQQAKLAVKRVMPATVCVTDGIGFGSGVVVSEDGYVLTAGHVLLTDGKELSLIFPDGRKVKAKRLGKNLNADAGMIKIVENGKWPCVELGDTASIKRGDWCIALGHSGGYVLGRRPPVRMGRVLHSNERRLVTDCALVGGDSGGPLIDLNGQLIGIHSSIGGSIAENRHVAIHVFQDDWDKLARGQTWGDLAELEKPLPNGPVLGVRLNKDVDGRAEVLSVSTGSAAEKAGIQAGDVIVSFDNEPIVDWQHLIDAIADKQTEDKVRLKVQREKIFVDLTVQLSRRDDS